MTDYQSEAVRMIQAAEKAASPEYAVRLIGAAQVYAYPWDIQTRPRFHTEES
jgi:hypothetical protein